MMSYACLSFWSLQFHLFHGTLHFNSTLHAPPASAGSEIDPGLLIQSVPRSEEAHLGLL